MKRRGQRIVGKVHGAHCAREGMPETLAGDEWLRFPGVLTTADACLARLAREGKNLRVFLCLQD